MRHKDIIQIFAEKDIFLSILNPLYFIEKIADGGREFLQKLLPAIKHEDVLNLLNDETRALLENENIAEPESYIKKCRDEVKEFEDNRTYFEGQLDILRPQHRELQAKLDSILANGREIVPRKEALENKQFEGIDVEALKSRQHSIASSLSGDKRETLLAKKAEAENRQYVSKLTDEIAKLRAEITAVRDKCNDIVKQANSIKVGDKCSFCHTVITEGNHKEIIAELKKQYTDMVNKGKELSEQYKELLEIEEKSKKKFEEFRAEDLQRINAELDNANTGDISEIAMLEDKIRIGNLTEEEYTELAELRKQTEAFAAEVDKLTNANEIEGKIKSVEKHLENVSARLIELQKLISASNQYAAKRAELSLKSLQMNRAAVSLYKVIKSTGEIKADFNFTYDGKDYRWLSASEKIKAGLEVANLLARLTGLQYPTFIDNAECITTKLDNVYGQVVLAYARNNALTVQTPQKNISQMKEAA